MHLSKPGVHSKRLMTIIKAGVLAGLAMLSIITAHSMLHADRLAHELRVHSTAQAAQHSTFHNTAKEHQELSVVTAVVNASYISKIPDGELGDYKKKVDAYVASAAFQEHAASLMHATPARGILVNAGGKQQLTNLLVTLKVLREQLNCTLPVEVAWDSDQGLSNETIAAMHKYFGPVYGLYLNTKSYPGHHRRPPRLGGFAGKVYSLLHTRFREVLVLDSDVTPLLEPSFWFEDARYQLAGNLFFPDFWDDWVKKEAFEAVGLNYDAARAALQSGKGYSLRDCESGAFLLDRVRHADVLEYLWWINSFYDKFYDKLIYGDKDSYALAFAVARKAHMYRQQSIPPGGVWTWGLGKGQVEWKDNKTREDGWELVGMIQYNDKAQGAFWHRTMGKFDGPKSFPVNIQLISGPLPGWWNHFYSAVVSTGASQCYKLQYCAPKVGVNRLMINPTITIKRRANNTLQEEDLQVLSTSCPLTQLAEYLTMIKLALPVQLSSSFISKCNKELVALLGTSSRYAGRPRKMGKGDAQDLATLVEETRMFYIKEEHLEGRVELQPHDAKAVPMLWLTPDADSPQLQAIRGAYSAWHWLNANLQRFPDLQ